MNASTIFQKLKVKNIFFLLIKIGCSKKKETNEGREVKK